MCFLWTPSEPTIARPSPVGSFIDAAADEPACGRSSRLADITTGMKIGDQVVFLDDEPVLDPPEGTPATVIAVRGPADIEFQLADGRVFTTLESSLGPAPTA
jgi:hypothetical protein